MFFAHSTQTSPVRSIAMHSGARGRASVTMPLLIFRMRGIRPWNFCSIWRWAPAQACWPGCSGWAAGSSSSRCWCSVSPCRASMPSILTHLAVGTSLATIIFTSVNAVREHHRRGAVRWPIFAWMTVGILIGAGFGALTAEAISGPEPAEDHRCVRPGHRRAAGAGRQAQGQPNGAGQSRSDRSPAA